MKKLISMAILAGFVAVSSIGCAEEKKATTPAKTDTKPADTKKEEKK